MWGKKKQYRRINMCIQGISPKPMIAYEKNSVTFDTQIKEPFYYHREYKNDIPQQPSDNGIENTWLNTCKRVSIAALPFVSLYKPLSFPLSLGMGGMRAVTSFAQLMENIQIGKTQDIGFSLAQTGVAVVALAGTIFAHPLGMFICTVQDIAMETAQLIHHLHSGEHKKAMESCLNLINNSLYLALFSHGGLELSIASLAMQILIGLNHSYAEFAKGRCIEGTRHLLMSMVRGNQLCGQVQMLQFKREIDSRASKMTNKSLCSSASVLEDSKTAFLTSQQKPSEIKTTVDLLRLDLRSQDQNTIQKIQWVHWAGEIQGWVTLADGATLFFDDTTTCTRAVLNMKIGDHIDVYKKGNFYFASGGRLADYSLSADQHDYEILDRQNS